MWKIDTSSLKPKLLEIKSGGYYKNKFMKCEYKANGSNKTDTEYWTLMSDYQNDPKDHGDFKVWWELSEFYILHQNKLFQSKNYSPKRKWDRCYLRIRYRTTKVGKEKHYCLTDPIIKILLGSDKFAEFKSSVETSKATAKKPWAAKRKQERQKVLKEKMLEQGITKEEVKLQENEARKAKANKIAGLKKIERTQRILSLTPALHKIKDEIEVVLKQMAAGEKVNLKYHMDTLTKLNTALRAVRSIKAE